MTHNYTDEENDGHQNVIINTTIYTSMSNIINNHFIIDLMQCPVKLMYILTVLDGKGTNVHVGLLDTFLVSARTLSSFTHGKTAHQSLHM